MMWEILDKLALALTIGMIIYLFVSNPREFVRDWILVPFFGASMRKANETPVAQPEPTDADDRIDAAGRALAAAWAGEATIIETLFDGVKRGGSTRYQQLRADVRAAAQRYGWTPPVDGPTISVTRDGRRYEISREEPQA